MSKAAHQKSLFVTHRAHCARLSFLFPWMLVATAGTASAQVVPQADDTEVPRGQHLELRQVAATPLPPPPQLNAPTPPPEPETAEARSERLTRTGQRLRKSGGVLLGLAPVAITASLLMFTLYQPAKERDCSKVAAMDDHRLGCLFNDFFDAYLPNTLERAGAGLIGVVGVGMLITGANLYVAGGKRLQQAYPTFAFTPLGSSRGSGGGMLTVAGRF